MGGGDVVGGVGCVWGSVRLYFYVDEIWGLGFEKNVDWFSGGVFFPAF